MIVAPAVISALDSLLPNRHANNSRDGDCRATFAADTQDQLNNISLHAVFGSHTRKRYTTCAYPQY